MYVSLSRKGMPGPSLLRSFTMVSCMLLSHGSQAVETNIKIFSGQGPNGYMRNVVYREVLEM
jgi:hypothetical protein